MTNRQRSDDLFVDNGGLIVRSAERSATTVTYGRAGTAEVRFRAATGDALESGANQLVHSVIQQNAARIAEAKDRRTAVPG